MSLISRSKSLSTHNEQIYAYLIDADDSVMDSVTKDCEELDPPESDGQGGTSWQNGNIFLRIYHARAVLVDRGDIRSEITNGVGHILEEEEDMFGDEEDEEGNVFKDVEGVDLANLYVHLMSDWDHAFDPPYEQEKFWTRI